MTIYGPFPPSNLSAFARTVGGVAVSYLCSCGHEYTDSRPVMTQTLFFFFLFNFSHFLGVIKSPSGVTAKYF